jgi:hypothetical protein
VPGTGHQNRSDVKARHTAIVTAGRPLPSVLSSSPAGALRVQSPTSRGRLRRPGNRLCVSAGADARVLIGDASIVPTPALDDRFAPFPIGPRDRTCSGSGRASGPTRRPPRLARGGRTPSPVLAGSLQAIGSKRKRSPTAESVSLLGSSRSSASVPVQCRSLTGAATVSTPAMVPPRLLADRPGSRAHRWAAWPL